MGLKPGRIYQEMIEVPDEPAGCGCLGWVVAIVAVLLVGIYILKFIVANSGLIFLVIIGIIAFIILRKRL